MTDFDLVGELECVWEVQAICGEGPLWVESEQSLYFLDIDGQKLHCYEEISNARRSLDLEGKPVGYYLFVFSCGPPEECEW